MLYDKIKGICKEQGIRISWLEKTAGLANGTIDGWKKAAPNIRSLQKVAEALDTTVEELIEGISFTGRQ